MSTSAQRIAPSDDVRILASDDQFRLAVSRDIVLVDWIAVPTKERVKAFENAIRDAGRAGTRATVIVRVRAPMKIPPQEIRDQLTSVIRDSEAITTGWSVALEGDGFWAAAHRTFSASMHMLSRSKVKMRIFKGVDLAAQWASELSGRTVMDVSKIVKSLGDD